MYPLAYRAYTWSWLSCVSAHRSKICDFFGVDARQLTIIGPISPRHVWKNTHWLAMGRSGVTGGGGQGEAECPPETSDRENFADVSGKKRQGKKGENWGGKLEMEAGKRYKKRWGPFFFFFFFFAFHFWKRRKFVLGLPKWEFSTGKKHFTPGKNQEKWLCPLRKICLLRPWWAG